MTKMTDRPTITVALNARPQRGLLGEFAGLCFEVGGGARDGTTLMLTADEILPSIRASLARNGIRPGTIHILTT